MIQYDRPHLSADDFNTLVHEIHSQLRHQNTRRLIDAVTALAIENRRLLLEVNEHRAARGFAPLMLDYDRR